MAISHLFELVSPSCCVSTLFGLAGCFPRWMQLNGRPPAPGGRGMRAAPDPPWYGQGWPYPAGGALHGELPDPSLPVFLFTAMVQTLLCPTAQVFLPSRPNWAGFFQKIHQTDDEQHGQPADGELFHLL